MICGIMGKARSGKDTLAKFLIEEFDKQGRKFENTAFAHVLKNMCISFFGLSHDQLYGDKKEVPDLRFAKGSHYGVSSNPADYWSPREIMQSLGSFFRSIDYDFWVKALDHLLKADRHKDWIITDVRHLNEAWYVKQNGFLINIIRKNAEEIHGMSHESETALDSYTDYDMVIDNNGTLEDLQNAAKDAVNLILKLESLKGEQKNG
jgi:hypothetical protein